MHNLLSFPRATILIKFERMLAIFVESQNARGERRLDPSLTLPLINDRLEIVTGISSSSMKLILDGTDISSGSSLYEAGARPGSVLQVVDASGARQRDPFSDLSQVEKYEIKDSEYDKLEG